MKKQYLRYLPLIAVGFVTILPLFFLLSTSLKSWSETQEMPPLFSPVIFAGRTIPRSSRNCHLPTTFSIP